MAINFLNNVDYNKNQLLNPRIQNEVNDAAAGTSVDGQLYYNTTDDELKVGEGGGWVAVGGGVESITTANSTYVNLADTGTAAIPVLTASLNAVDGVIGAATDRFLTKGNKWALISTIPGTYAWSINSDLGFVNPVASGDTIKFEGGTNVTTTFNATTDTLTINSTDQFVGTLTGITEGTYISIDNSTPAVPVVNALGTEAATASRLVARDGSGYGYVVTPASGDSTTKIATTAFVQAAVTGLLEFKGGFNASTGAIVGGGNLTSVVSRVAVAVGDYYVVTVAGDFFGNAATPLTPGDSVIVQTAAAADASVEADFIVVQSDTDLATLTTVGIGNVNAATGDELLGINVVYSSGTAKVGLDIDGLTSVATTSSASVLAVYDEGTSANKQITVSNLLSSGNSATSFAATVTAATQTITHGLATSDVIVQLYDITTGETVYADVDRISTTQVTISFASTPTNSIRVLVQKIG